MARSIGGYSKGKYTGNFGNILEELACYKVIIKTGKSVGVPDSFPPLKTQIMHN